MKDARTEVKRMGWNKWKKKERKMNSFKENDE